MCTPMITKTKKNTWNYKTVGAYRFVMGYYLSFWNLVKSRLIPTLKWTTVIFFYEKPTSILQIIVFFWSLWENNNDVTIVNFEEAIDLKFKNSDQAVLSDYISSSTIDFKRADIIDLKNFIRFINWIELFILILSYRTRHIFGLSFLISPTI